MNIDTASTGKLVVVGALNNTDDGNLVPAFDPRQVDTEECAVREAKVLATVHAGVMAWSRMRIRRLENTGQRRSCFSMASCRIWTKVDPSH